MDKSYNGFVLSDSHFPLGAEAGIPRQEPEAGTNTFIYMLVLKWVIFSCIINFLPQSRQGVES